MTRRRPAARPLALDALLAAGAAIRMSRFVTTDSLGDWTIVRPLKRWAWRREVRDVLIAENPGIALHPSMHDEPIAPTPEPENGWRSKIATGIECPFCVGFWVALASLAALALARGSAPRPAADALRVVYGALGMNYALAHLSSRLDV